MTIGPLLFSSSTGFSLQKFQHNRSGPGSRRKAYKGERERAIRESISRRKEWFLAVTGTEMPEMISVFGNRKLFDDLGEGI